MKHQQTRRHFLQSATCAGATIGLGGLGEWAGLLPFSPANADDAKATPDLVRFTPDIEPIVRLIEETPRDKCVAVMIDQLRKGLPYRFFLAGLYLANIRSNQVNHALAMVHSAHELSLEMPAQERLLPLFRALDSFKWQQVRSPPSLKPLTGKLPSAEQAEKELHAGMAAHDAERAERAMVALVRCQAPARVAELFWHYGARDFTFIGHFPIWTANSLRPLATIGWRHAEPILRVVITSIVSKNKNLDGSPYAANIERIRKALIGLPADWAGATAAPGLTKDLLVLIRERKTGEVCQLAMNQMAQGKAQAGAIWDAVHLAAGEMMMCAQKNSTPLHANTAANALHYAFQASGDAETRLLALLQAVGWMCIYRSSLADHNWLKEPKEVTEIVGAKIPEIPERAVEEILTNLSYGPGGKPTAEPWPGSKGSDFNSASWRHEAASKVFTFAKQFAGNDVLRREAFRLLPVKADFDAHRLKFPIAALENCGWVNPVWQPHMLAVASYSFIGADALDTDVAKQAREALRQEKGTP